jgi:hypothetical protein
MPEFDNATARPAARRGRTRQERAVAWTVGHFAELAGVTSPLVAGAMTTVWLDVLSVAVATWWALHEVRARRTRAALLGQAPPPAALTAGRGATRSDTTTMERTEERA